MESKERRLRTLNDLYTYTVDSSPYNGSNVIAYGLYLNVINVPDTTR